jgi:hypothetical protein
MKKEKSLSELFEQARRAQAEVPVGDVKSLLESGYTSPLAAKPSFRPRRITRLFNPLKMIVMITPVVIITSALLLIHPGGSRNSILSKDSLEISKSQVISIVEDPLKKESRASPFTEQKSNELEDTGLKSLGIPVGLPEPSPDDSLFQGVILNLTKEELSRLGFMFDQEGYYYLNQLPDGSKLNFWSWQGNQGGSFGFGAGGYVNQADKADLVINDFYPVILTNLEGENLYPLNTVKGITTENFELVNDTLVPVYFSSASLGGYNKVDDQLVWFKVSPRFFNLINSDEGNRSQKIFNDVKALQNQLVERNRVQYQYNTELPQLNILKIKTEDLACMGIIIARDSIKYEIKIKGSDYCWYAHEKGVGIRRLTIGMPGDLNQPWDGLLVYSITTDVNNRVGNLPVGFPLESADLIIPVQIDDEMILPVFKKLVFWIYPNEKFFSCLPPEIAEPLRKEFNYQLKRIEPNFVPRMGGSIGIGGGGLQKDSSALKTEPVPCVYFANLCEAIPGLDNISLFPNPATDKLNVELILQKAKMIRFRVFDMSGKLLSGDEPPQNYPDAGRITHTLDISSLQQGFYLMVVTDEEGQRVTRRFIKN